MENRPTLLCHKNKKRFLCPPYFLKKIQKIFGRISKFKSKDELLEDEFEKFVAIYKP